MSVGRLEFARYGTFSGGLPGMHFTEDAVSFTALIKPVMLDQRGKGPLLQDIPEFLWTRCVTV